MRPAGDANVMLTEELAAPKRPSFWSLTAKRGFFRCGLHV
jgi:hypothetical protein